MFMKVITFFINKKLFKPRQPHVKTENFKGFTLIEIMTVLAIAGILAAMSAPFIKFGVNPLRDNTNRFAGNFKLIRIKAMAETSAYRVGQPSSTQLIVERAASCFDTTWTVAPSFTAEDLSLAEAEDIQGIAKNEDIQIVAATVNGVVVTPPTNWKICYNSQGIADVNLVLTLKDIKTSKQRQIEVFRGGAVQIYE